LLDEKNWAATTARVDKYPTTFFFDRHGKLVFEHAGGSDVLVEEFMWRIRALTDDQRHP
jgi:hypothetical protein